MFSKDLWLGRASFLNFHRCPPPNPAVFHQGKEQLERAGTSVPVQQGRGEGLRLLGKEPDRAGKCSLPRGLAHRGIFPSMQRGRQQAEGYDFREKKKKIKLFLGRDFLHSAQHQAHSLQMQCQDQLPFNSKLKRSGVGSPPQRPPNPLFVLPVPSNYLP